jgi:hypothetical protein
VVDYYKILGVEPSATGAEIKSAYRRLARQRHPDLNGGSEQAARRFALLSLAYRTLNDPQERAAYDAKREKERQRRNAGFVMHSDNIHARRMRMVTIQARCDRVVDMLLEADRRANSERSQAVFTTVTLFFSTFIVALLKPKFWQIGVIGKAIVITLFVMGLWHLATRLREYFRRYTYKPERIHVSIMTEETPSKPFTRFSAYVFLVVGYVVCIAAGLLAGDQLHYVMNDMRFIFDQNIRPDLIFYPPIAVLFVDTMHNFASKIDS